MSEEQKLLSDIKKKKTYLKNRLEETDDSLERRTIAFSISSYLQMEYSLSKLNFFINGMGKAVLKRDFLLEKSGPYLDILFKNSDYYLDDLDLDYAISLIDILSEKCYFPIPNTLSLTNNELIDVSKKFYQECFDGEVKEKGLELLNDSTVFFPTNDFYCPDNVGKNYADPYFGDNYSFIKRQYNDVDLVSVPHEIFHGINFKLNPEGILNSIPETEEASTNAIEFILYNFLEQLYSPVGENLKKLTLFNIGFEASALRKKLLTNLSEQRNITNFMYLETKIIGYGIYLLYKEDKRKGEEKLIEFAKHNFSKDKLPDYSSLGFSKKVILSLAELLARERYIYQQSKLDEIKQSSNQK